MPPDGYGGIERIVALLCERMTARGHEVTLFASGGSTAPGRLESVFDAAPGPEALGDLWWDLQHATFAYDDPERFDVIHDHTLIGPALGAQRGGRPPVVHTLHGPWHPKLRQFYDLIHERVHLVAIAEWQRERNPAIRYAGLVPNGIDVERVPFSDAKGDYAVFLGRSNEEKAPERAVDIAAEAGLPLTMIVKRAERFEQEHWRRHVEPRLRGTETVLEAVSDEEKHAVLGGAAALIMPGRWEEPFGLAMVEAMACGTPVVASNRGAPKEIVADGVTGFLGDSDEELAAALGRVHELDPAACRQRVASHYSADAMADGYEAVYERVAPAFGQAPVGG